MIVCDKCKIKLEYEWDESETKELLVCPECGIIFETNHPFRALADDGQPIDRIASFIREVE